MQRPQNAAKPKLTGVMAGGSGGPETTRAPNIWWTAEFHAATGGKRASCPCGSPSSVLLPIRAPVQPGQPVPLPFNPVEDLLDEESVDKI